MDLATPAQDQRKSIGRLTRLMARSLSMVWQSARTPFLALIGLQLLNAIALALQILAVQLALTGWNSGNTGDLWPLVQPVLLLAGLDRRHCGHRLRAGGARRYAGELVVAVMWKRVLRVATRVDLRKFESARFYDRLHRVQANAPTRPYQITHGLVATTGAAAASAGLLIAIVLVHPHCCRCFWSVGAGTADEPAAEPAGVRFSGSADAIDATAELPDLGTDGPG